MTKDLEAFGISMGTSLFPIADCKLWFQLWCRKPSTSRMARSVTESVTEDEPEGPVVRWRVPVSNPLKPCVQHLELMRSSSPRTKPSDHRAANKGRCCDRAWHRRDTAPVPEEIARALTWGADEKVLLVLAATGWLASRGRSQLLRRAGNHTLLVTVAASLLPHGLKILFDQTRPDRRTVLGHVHGISFSGKREDAFPSGHALHMGALASAAGTLPAGPRWTIRSLAIGLSLTRVAILAHWLSDVVVGIHSGRGPGAAAAPMDGLSDRNFERGLGCRVLKI